MMNHELLGDIYVLLIPAGHGHPQLSLAASADRLELHE